MAFKNAILDTILSKINNTGLQNQQFNKEQHPVLFQVLKDLASGTKKVDTDVSNLNNNVTAIIASGIIGNGTPGSIAGFTSTQAIGDRLLTIDDLPAGVIVPITVTLNNADIIALPT